MKAVCAYRVGEIGVGADKEQNAAALADCGVTRGDKGAFRIVIIAINDGGPGRKRTQDRLRIGDPATVSQKSE